MKKQRKRRKLNEMQGHLTTMTIPSPFVKLTIISIVKCLQRISVTKKKKL